MYVHYIPLSRHYKPRILLARADVLVDKRRTEDDAQLEPEWRSGREDPREPLLGRGHALRSHWTSESEDSDRRRKEQKGAHDESNASDARERAHGSIGKYVRQACAPWPAPAQRVGRARGARARDGARTRRESSRGPALTAGRRLRRVVGSVPGEWSDLP